MPPSNNYILIDTILKGAATGLILALSFGAGFFSLLQTSIEKGYKKGLYIALGMIISDLVFIALCIFAASFVENQIRELDTEIRFVGFIALTVLGIKTYFKKPSNPDAVLAPSKGKYLYIMKGVMLNSINPLTLLFWLGMAAFVKSNLPSYTEVTVFFGVTLSAMFLTQFVICYSANKVKHMLSIKMQHVLNHIIGIVFVIVAFIMVWPLIEKIIN